LSDFPENGDEKYYYVDLSTEKIYTYTSTAYVERFTGAGGGVVFAYSDISVNTALDENNFTANCTQPITITLPTAIGIQGTIYNIKNSSSGAVSVQCFGSQTIDKENLIKLKRKYESITIQSSGANWIII
jgi:hypothetical protein